VDDQTNFKNEKRNQSLERVRQADLTMECLEKDESRSEIMRTIYVRWCNWGLTQPETEYQSTEGGTLCSEVGFRGIRDEAHIKFALTYAACSDRGLAVLPMGAFALSNLQDR
jgi:hypothetical protein